MALLLLKNYVAIRRNIFRVTLKHFDLRDHGGFKTLSYRPIIPIL